MFCSPGLSSDFISLMLSKGQSQAQLPSRGQMACRPALRRLGKLRNGAFRLQKQRAPTDSFNSERSSWSLSIGKGHRSQAGHSRVRDSVTLHPQALLNGCPSLSQAVMAARQVWEPSLGELSGSCSGQGSLPGFALKPTLGLEQLRGPSPTISWELHHP